MLEILAGQNATPPLGTQVPGRTQVSRLDTEYANNYTTAGAIVKIVIIVKIHNPSGLNLDKNFTQLPNLSLVFIHILHKFASKLLDMTYLLLVLSVLIVSVYSELRGETSNGSVCVAAQSQL